MDSALSPREIQSRIRGGDSMEDVAQAAGVPVEKVEPFAAPVLAERAHVAGTAQAAPVRRRGEPTSNHQPLRSVIHDYLSEHGVEDADLDWDAWRVENRKWIVRVSFELDDEPQQAEFLYDQMGRFCVAHDDEARRLTGEWRPAAAETEQPEQPDESDEWDPDVEPTLDYSDEFALVRAVGAEAPRDDDSAGAGVPGDDELVVTEISHVREVRVVDDEYADAGLTQVDGVYDLVPHQGGLDMIYDLLGTYAEEGTPYDFSGETPQLNPEAAGLAEEPSDDEVPQRDDEVPQRDDEDALPGAVPAPPRDSSVEPGHRDATVGPDTALASLAGPSAAAEEPLAPRPEDFDEPSSAAASAVADEPAEGGDDPSSTSGQDADVVAPRPEDFSAEDPTLSPSAAPVTPADEAAVSSAASEAAPAVAVQSDAVSAPPADAGQASAAPASGPEPAQAPTRARPVAQEPREPSQDPLVDSPAPAPKPAPKRKKRAAVPSWDEIMFGGPKPKK